MTDAVEQVGFAFGDLEKVVDDLIHLLNEGGLLVFIASQLPSVSSGYH